MKTLIGIKIIITVFALSFVFVSDYARQTESKSDKKWWKEAVVYQIYPRSFKDSNGDGVGDLQGIISKLDYVKSLGIDAVWLNPIYASPNDDNGYDISDYRDIMKEFGTMADFDVMLSEMHKRGIRLIMDLVVNHSSDEHKWFKESRKSRTNPYRDYYHWWPAEKGKPAFRPSYFDEEGSAWRYDSITNAYYLHYFSRKQPDLNWENPKVRQEVYSIMKFWFDKGVDGFRMDVIPFISKDTSFPVITPDMLKKYTGGWAEYYADGPHLHEYLKEMRREVLDKYPDVMALGEGAGVTLANAHKFVDADRKELDMFFHFDAVGLGLSPKGYKLPDDKGWSLVDLKKVYTKWSDVFAQKGWGSIYLGNHDQPRMVSRWGNDDPAYREASAKMLFTFLLSMRATPYVYYGDELGMTNIRFNNISDYRDIETLNWYKLLKSKGEDISVYLKGWQLTARDNGRTPFQWDAGTNAGFSTSLPWIKINPDYITVNEHLQENDPQSILNYFRKMIHVRKGNKILVYGDYKLLDKDNPQVYAFTRGSGSNRVLVLLNFSKETVVWNIPDDLKLSSHILINNYPELKTFGHAVSLNAYQAICVELK
ncbi:MAG: alpha-glucosidase [Paludibacter sp.]|nr:alpha-glucosidase [Paludibacter sp.]